METCTYRGRFAPSPTGPLHFGSLVAALGSCLEARARGGEWLVRIEDVDAPRCRPEMAADILRTLEAHGFAWDGEVMVQSLRTARYEEILERLRRKGRVYPCGCTRREIGDAARAVDGAALYPGTCRVGLPPGRPGRAWRARVDDASVTFIDGVQGPVHQDLARAVGDFVVFRADGHFAYQLAVVTDDADQGITHVVRGADLLDSTPRQIFLFESLGLAAPAYAHLPVAVNADGEKLSKQTRATPLDRTEAARALFDALDFLGQRPPPGLRGGAVAEVWDWALAHWRLDRVPRTRTIIPDSLFRRNG